MRTRTPFHELLDVTSRFWQQMGGAPGARLVAEPHVQHHSTSYGRFSASKLALDVLVCSGGRGTIWTVAEFQSPTACRPTASHLPRLWYC
jgi:hypothetical protein